MTFFSQSLIFWSVASMSSVVKNLLRSLFVSFVVNAFTFVVLEVQGVKHGIFAIFVIGAALSGDFPAQALVKLSRFGVTQTHF